MLPTTTLDVVAVLLPPRPSLTVTDGVNVPPCVKTRVKEDPFAALPSPIVQAYVNASPSGSVAVAVSVNVVSPWMPNPGEIVALTDGSRFGAGCGVTGVGCVGCGVELP